MPSAPDNPQSDPPAADDSFRALAARAPFSIFAEWFADARRADPEGACAATLATTDGDGQAQARTVLVKDFADDELPFFTNLQSRKARALAANPRAALLFFWRGERPARQALFEGECAPIERARAAAYFASRPRESQIGAWASRQSQPLADFADLTARGRKNARSFRRRRGFVAAVLGAASRCARRASSSGAKAAIACIGGSNSRARPTAVGDRTFLHP